ncbi:perlucin-like [Dreissena polymorpha]|uniref:perlucin-like n=1 Tax=Dreissena polymorpha TaxID=45954 RepID=UPI002264AE40|nr:perlucin-like [Dreissena polymorpha]
MKSQIIVLLSALVFQAHGACQPGFESLGENCYVILQVPASWGEALHYCQAMGASLAVIRNKQEEALIDEYIHRQHDLIRTGQLWIGGTDLLQEGIFLAPNSLETLTYFNWAPGQPDNIGTGQHCVSIFKDDAMLRWDDNNCDVKNWPLCQREPLENMIVVG